MRKTGMLIVGLAVTAFCGAGAQPLPPGAPRAGCVGERTEARQDQREAGRDRREAVREYNQADRPGERREAAQDYREARRDSVEARGDRRAPC